MTKPRRNPSHPAAGGRSAVRLAGRALAVGAATTVVGLAALGSGAAAHVSPDRTEVPADSYTDIKLGVGHGCDGSPTTKLEVQVPAEVVNITPYVVPGWSAEVTTETLDEPIEGGHGEQITERDAVVTWTAEPGNELADGFKLQFGLSFRAPDLAGTYLHFPAIQTCAEGQTDWIQIPVEGEEEPAEPAPTVLIVASEGGGHGDSSDTSTNQPTTEGDGAGAGSEGSTDADATGSGDSSDGGSDDGGSGNGLAITGLVAGLGGLALGGAAFAQTRKA